MALKSIFVSLVLLFGSLAQAQDDIILYSEHDGTMNEAIAEARATFPLFMAQYYNDSEETGAFLGAFSVKVEFLMSDGVTDEVIWVSPFIETDDGFFGLLANEPNDLPGLQYGSEVNFMFAQISDWSYRRDGRAFGNYTTRVMIADMDKETAQQVRDYISAAPLPAEWAP